MAAGPAAEFEEERALLFGLAYRLLGSAADAEDVIQDTYVQWSGADQAAIGVPPVWPAMVATNSCLNRLAWARVHRDVYIGPWLPEPVLTSDGTLGPMESAAQRESWWCSGATRPSVKTVASLRRASRRQTAPG